MRIGRWALSSVLIIGAWGSAIAADLESSIQDPVCRVSDEEQQKMGCVCVGPRVAKPLHAALLTEIQGDVLKSTPVGFSPVTEPTPLDIGDTVQVKSKSSALLTVGMECSREIGPNASLIVRETEQGCACAALLEETPKKGLLHVAIVVGAGILIAKHFIPHSP